MLIDVQPLRGDPFAAKLEALMQGGGEWRLQWERLQEGVFLVNTLNPHMYLDRDRIEECPNLSDDPDSPWGPSTYGVCDGYSQVLDFYPNLETSERKFFVLVSVLRKSDQPSDGGWRWHKWGPYIGKLQPTAEYLYDEPHIDQVMLYKIYEVKS